MTPAAEALTIFLLLSLAVAMCLILFLHRQKAVAWLKEGIFLVRSNLLLVLFGLLILFQIATWLEVRSLSGDLCPPAGCYIRIQNTGEIGRAVADALRR